MTAEQGNMRIKKAGSAIKQHGAFQKKLCAATKQHCALQKKLYAVTKQHCAGAKQHREVQKKVGSATKQHGAFQEKPRAVTKQHSSRDRQRHDLKEQAGAVTEQDAAARNESDIPITLMLLSSDNELQEKKVFVPRFSHSYFQFYDPGFMRRRSVRDGANCKTMRIKEYHEPDVFIRFRV